ncbi:hypothetical protein GA0070620_0575 [Micromonospora krabiensis]|uniref:Uncharacterized protein n=2 Tax=Micromonospora krabiensis TaxID=307121 RepID=A0A1C3MXP0_9ACTN|nr:hypothetical protein GA0070620_0575 [Micromonospora krabiensis]
MIFDMTRAAKVALIAGPLALSGYGVARLIGRLDDAYGPGLDWQVAHVLGLAGFLLFVPLVLALRTLTRSGPVRELAIGATLLGLAATVIQFGADIVLAAMAADKEELRDLQGDFSALPGLRPVVYDVGPLLFFVGIVVVAVLAARARRLPWWSPVVLLVAVLLPPVNLDLMPLAGLLMLVALLPGRNRSRKMPVG